MAATCQNWEEARDRLRKMREEQTRRSDEVVELWEELLSDFSYKLQNEEWVVYEQVCIAACDCGRLDTAEQCIANLDTQFPRSTRVRWLRGLLLEAEGNFKEAEETYREILKSDETSSLARKRLVAVLREQNRIPEAIGDLSKYLEQYMSDFEAWMELCDLYLQELDYAKAAFCMEELLIANPYNHLLHQKYAEIKYTLGTTESIEHAKKYFAYSLKLNPGNLRSLFGFFLSASHLAQKASNAKAKKDNAEYAEAAWKQIMAKYQSKMAADGTVPGDDAGPQQMLAITGMLSSLQMSS